MTYRGPDPRFTIRDATIGDLAACEAILRSLPDWFGIDEAIDAYVHDIAEMRTIVADFEGALAGFLSVNIHNEATLEIHVMAVAAEHHRSGIGRALVETAERMASSAGCRLVEVKTLGPSHSSEHYAATRRFYQATGFLPVEEIDGLWPGNPCLIMVKVLDV